MPVLPCPNRQDAGWILQLGLSLTWAGAAETRFLTYAFGRAVDDAQQRTGRRPLVELVF